MTLQNSGDIETNVIITKDIIRRVKLNSRVANSAFSYDPYDIQEGERPDILAHQFYNSSKFAWVIMVTNEIHDLYEDWPRTERELKNMINKKYGGMGPYAVKGTETSTGNYYSGVNGYYYPLFLSSEEARNYDRLKEFTGGAHTHTFSEFPSTVYSICQMVLQEVTAHHLSILLYTNYIKLTLVLMVYIIMSTLKHLVILQRKLLQLQQHILKLQVPAQSKLRILMLLLIECMKKELTKQKDRLIF